MPIHHPFANQNRCRTAGLNTDVDWNKSCQAHKFREFLWPYIHYKIASTNPLNCIQNKKKIVSSHTIEKKNPLFSESPGFKGHCSPEWTDSSVVGFYCIYQTIISWACSNMLLKTPLKIRRDFLCCSTPYMKFYDTAVVQSGRCVEKFMTYILKCPACKQSLVLHNHLMELFFFLHLCTCQGTSAVLGGLFSEVI